MKRVAIGALVVCATSSHALLIDDFSSHNFSQTISSGTFAGAYAGSMLGGERDAGMGILANPLSTALHSQVGGGVYSGSSDAQLDGLVSLQYDGIGDETNNVLPFEVGPGLGSLNLTVGADRFRFSFTSNDQPLTLRVMVGTDPGLLTNVAFTVGANASPFNFDVMFSSVVGPASLTDVDRLTFVFDTAPGGDFGLDSISTVPEPGTIIAVAAGVAGLIARRRRAR